jgi:hypothetical protein
VLLVRHIEVTGSKAEILLANGEQVIVDGNVRDLEVTRKLYRNLAPVAEYLAPGVRNPPYLRKHIYEDVVVFIIRNDETLVDQDGATTLLGYSEHLGVYRKGS